MKVAEKLYPLRERRGRGGSDMAIMFDGNFFLAVIASTILSFVIGGIWYAGPVFGQAWMAALGKTEADKEAMRKQAPEGFVVWFGFLLTTGVSGAIFEGRSSKLLGINLGFAIVSYLMMGAILGIWL